MMDLLECKGRREKFKNNKSFKIYKILYAGKGDKIYGRGRKFR